MPLLLPITHVRRLQLSDIDNAARVLCHCSENAQTSDSGMTLMPQSVCHVSPPFALISSMSASSVTSLARWSASSADCPSFDARSFNCCTCACGKKMH